MTIIVFLIDTSASMNQRAYLGGRPTLLDVAKGAVETFVKVRQRSPESRGDRYMLLTFEDPPANIKAGWKENLATFINELKNLQCFGLTTMGAALKHAFDVLNINRMQTGIDTYGQGRCPFYLEPSVIVVITDGGKLSSNAGVQDDFNLPMNCPIPGSELTREPFRWDQRLFSLVLRLSGTPAVERDSGLVPSDSSPIDAMCEVTGGRSYCITSHRMLMQCIDSLVQKVQSGVVINFEKIGPDPPPLDGAVGKDGETPTEEIPHDTDKEFEDAEKNGRWNGAPYQTGPIMGQNQGPAPQAWHSCRRLIYVPRTVSQKGFAVGFWPIPESFRPDPNAATLPPRSAHPAVKFTCSSQEPMVIDNLPFDKYELEPSPLTQFILARKQPTICWQVFVASSGCKNAEVSHPFGYLKASTNLTCVNLFVLPYNYPVLLPLLDELFKLHRCKPTPEWKMAFQQYLDRMPSYYVAPLRRALAKMGASPPLVQSLVPDTQDNSLSFSVLNYLKRLKNQAKIEFDKLCADVINKAGGNQKVADTVRVIPRSPLKKDLTTHPCLQDKFSQLRDQLNEFGGFVVGLSRGRHKAQAHTYRNPFDIQRRDLLDQVVRMRANFLQPSLAHTKLLDDDSLHSMPVAQMGNYQEYLKRMTPQLREIETQPVRQHMFGNPFKIDKRMMVDEADIDPMGTMRSGAVAAGSKRTGESTGRAALPPKRKAGPIPQHVQARRPSTPVTPPMSPISLPMSPIPSPMSPISSPMSPIVPPMSPTQRRPATPLLPLSSTVLDVAPGRPPEEPTIVDTGGTTPASSGSPPSSPVPAAPPNLPPIIKPFLNGDAYTTMGTKMPRSPSPPPEPSYSPQMPPHSTNNTTHPPYTSSHIPHTLSHASHLSSLQSHVAHTTSLAAHSSSHITIPTSHVTHTSSHTPHTSSHTPHTISHTPHISSHISQTCHAPHTVTPTREVIPPVVHALDTQEMQISAILQGIAAAAENNSHGRGKKRRRSKSESKPPPPPSPTKIQAILAPPPPSGSRKELSEIRRHNLNVRAEAYRAIRRPGRDFSKLFDHLKELKGGTETKKEVVQEIIDESLRFKRKALAKLLEDFSKNLEKNGNGVKKEIKTLTNLYSNALTNSH